LLQAAADFAILQRRLDSKFESVKNMQVIEEKTIEIDDALLVELQKAAEFEQKTVSDYVDEALHAALKATENKRLLPEKIRKHKESYEKFPQDLDDSEEEWEHWRKQYEEFEKRSEK